MTKEEIMKLAISNGLNISYITEEETSLEISNESKDGYVVPDCIMVRTTDIFPVDRIVQTPENGNAVTYARSEIFDDVIVSRIRSKYPKVMDEEQENEYASELREFEIPFDITRSTVHFTLNGLVSSHMYGNFQNKDYIILEPFDEHVDEESLVGLRVEDTYFNGDIELSSRAVIMMNKDSFVVTISNPERAAQLQNFNIVVFEGAEEKAVDYVLHGLGYNCFKINNHGYVAGLTDKTEDNKMYNFVHQVATNLGISQERHFYSPYRANDFNKSLKKDEERNKDYFDYIVENSSASDELKGKLKRLSTLNDSIGMRRSPYIESFVDEVGLDSLKQLTKDYNKHAQEKAINQSIKK